MIREWRILTDNVVVQWRQDRAHFPPWGSAGGKNGTPARAFHISGDKTRELKKEIFVANKGDLIRGILAGGGGWGNPFERDVQKVLEDVRNDVVSIEAAKKDYGVAINKDTMQINMQETKILREHNYETGSS
jgi:N-methylhydantoinase B